MRDGAAAGFSSRSIKFSGNSRQRLTATVKTCDSVFHSRRTESSLICKRRTRAHSSNCTSDKSGSSTSASGVRKIRPIRLPSVFAPRLVGVTSAKYRRSTSPNGMRGDTPARIA
ncbi:hypothetical protein ACLD9W_06415 [Neisseria sp. WLZKY-1]|uniref:hypothetical protein n=1 Tax=Neisseria sp. WLZKY-1 TaxID=3390377 RepID=UPI003978550D